MNTEPQPLEGIILTPEAPDGLVSLTTAQPLDLFTTPGIIPALLAAVRAEAVRDFTPDLTTDKGRKAIASRAFKVSRTKTFLDGIGKDEVARLKELPRQVDAGRKALRDGLDQLADEIRKPLTDWEARVDGIKARLTDLQNLPARLMNATAAIIEQALTDLQRVDPASFEEFAGEAQGIIVATKATVEEQLERRRKFEADQAELERLRAEEAERQAEAERERLRKEGEERARKAAEAAAAAAAAQPQAPAPQTSTDQQAHPPTVATTPAIATVPAQTAATAAPSAEQDWRSIPAEARAPKNREALEDLTEALVAAKIFTPDAEGRQASETTAKAVLTAIVQGKVRHIAISY